MHSRRTRVAVHGAGLIALSLLAAACTSGADTAAPPTAAAPTPTVTVSSAAASPTPAPTPSGPLGVRAAPNKDLKGGQVVTATATGFAPSTPITIAVCPTGRKVTGPGDCGPSKNGNAKQVVTNEGGMASAQITVPQGALYNATPPAAKCPPCWVVAFDSTTQVATQLSYAQLGEFHVMLPARPAPAGPLPAGLVPATPARLVGTWVPVSLPTGATPGKSYVTFVADQRWHGSDGCNGGGGGWALGKGGAFRATSGGSTAIYCPGASVPSWVANSTQLAFNGSQLVLFEPPNDPTVVETGPPPIHRLVRK